MKNQIIFCVILLFIININQGKTQGCSDAGLCSIGSHQSNFLPDTSKSYRHQVGLSFAAGVGDFDTNIFTPALAYTYQVSSKLSFQGRLTYNIADGDLGSLSDFGDIYLSTTYQFLESKSVKMLFNLGVKVPLNEGDLQNDNFDISLPMTYQSSLGTYDLLTGLSLNWRQWVFSAGLQLPLNNENANNFDPTGLNQTVLDAFPPTRNFRRAPDLLLRVQKHWQLAQNRFRLNAGLLGIYHLQNDEFRTLTGEFREIEDSQGLTLNLTFGADYSVNEKLSVGLSWGNPVAVREQRPDGLTRRFVITPSVSWRF